jgi:sRNA-binding carbon storage regulator CsrA
MLVMSQRVGEAIVMDGNIKLTILGITGNQMGSGRRRVQGSVSVSRRTVGSAALSARV